jgi:hypothetical protein
MTIGVSQTNIVIANRTINTKTNYTIRISNNSIVLNSSGKTIITFPPEAYVNSQLTGASCNINCKI